MTHIAILCNADAWGGLELNVAKLAVWLHQRGNPILFLAPPNTAAFRFASEKQVPVYAFESRRKYVNIPAIWKLKGIIKQYEITRLLIAHSKDINLGALTKLLVRTPLSLMYLQQMNIAIPKKDVFHTFFYKQLDIWIAPLASIAEKTLQLTRLSSDKIRIIPLCIEVAKFLEVSQQKAIARQRFNLPSEAIVVGIVGRLDPGKGQAHLIEATALLREKGITVEVLLVGDETKHDTRAYPTYLRKLAEEKAVTVHFHPFIEEVALAFAALDAFVMASVAETYGMVTVEAMATGVPVIGAKAGGTVDLIDEGETGFFFEPENAVDLAEVLEKLLRDQALSKVISQQAQKKATQYYAHTYQCAQMEKIFEQPI
ncbi:MAG: glycosyltransferase family 4 protein [Thermonemataceae bacterium]